MAVRIEDVAARAGVSVATVSQTLGGRRPVAAATRQRVLEVVEELGYSPNLLAAGLRTRRSLMSALIIPDLTNPFYPVLARGLERVLTVASYQSFITNTDGDRERELAAVRLCVQRQADGIVLAPFGLTAEDLESVSRMGVPVVLLQPTANHQRLPCDAVVSDDARGVASAVMHLAERGHRRIGMLNGSPSQTAAARLRGYRGGMQAAGLTVEEQLLRSTSFTRDGGRELAVEMLDGEHPPTAVVCGNDMIAIGVLDIARDRGLRVPTDLAVVGFDDIDAALLTHPPLTTVVNPGEEIGQAAGSVLLDRIRGDYSGAPRRLTVSGRLVVRSSS